MHRERKMESSAETEQRKTFFEAIRLKQAELQRLEGEPGKEETYVLGLSIEVGGKEYLVSITYPDMHPQAGLEVGIEVIDVESQRSRPDRVPLSKSISLREDGVLLERPDPQDDQSAALNLDVPDDELVGLVIAAFNAQAKESESPGEMEELVN